MIATLLLGRAIDADGTVADGGPPVRARGTLPPLRIPAPHERAPIDRPMWTGVRAIDGLLTLGRGARIGIFGAPGAGKSTLLEALVSGARADAIVLALIGERGREAQTWIESIPAHATIACATSDRPARERIAAAELAMRHACALRERGLHVLMIADSLARFASALREAAVRSGEPVGRAGFPPSVFAQLARYTEAAGTAMRGSITLIATVLSDGDDRDPISDAARSLLDGHVALSPALAHAGRFPAIDVPASASRTMSAVAAPEHAEDAALVRRAVAFLTRTEETRTLGIVPSDPFALRALALEDDLERFLRQGKEPSAPGHTLNALRVLADRLR